MRKTREQFDVLRKKRASNMEEKHINKHLDRDMKESKKSIEEDKDLKKYLKRHK